MSLNGIAHLNTKEARQLAKLDIAEAKRQGYATIVQNTTAYSWPTNFSLGDIKITVNDVDDVYLHFYNSVPSISNQLTVGMRVTIDWDGRAPNTVATISSQLIDFPGHAWRPQGLGFLLTIITTTELPGNSEDYNIEALHIPNGTFTGSGSPNTSAPYYRGRNVLEITQLPNPYNDNDIDPDENPNTSGLVVGRPWISNPSPVTQDLILFFDSNRTDCYPGTGTTIYNLVDNTPSTLGGNCTFSNGVIRLNNDTGNKDTNNARINCQTVTNFRTISLWYRQVSDGGNVTRYILDARDGVGGGYIYTGDPYGPAWTGSTMYEDGGVGVQVNYTEQIGTWRNLTLVNTAPMTDDITLFSRYTNDEALDVEFGAVMIYSRAITYEENLQNFNQFKTRYGL